MVFTYAENRSLWQVEITVGKVELRHWIIQCHIEPPCNYIIKLKSSDQYGRLFYAHTGVGVGVGVALSFCISPLLFGWATRIYRYTKSDREFRVVIIVIMVLVVYYQYNDHWVNKVHEKKHPPGCSYIYIQSQKGTRQLAGFQEQEHSTGTLTLMFVHHYMRLTNKNSITVTEF